MNSPLALLKDVPARAIPFVIFLGACVSFGELFIRVPINTEIDLFVKWFMAFCTLASALLFFTKVFLDQPRMRGLELD